ncbi:MAG: hypothetical protein KBT15_09560 [Bacteroidales bacterium]|nr:hypothetical protein [Candidatus Minthousia equi]
MELTFAMIASIAVVIVVVVFQISKFIQNRKRIELFSEIFVGKEYDLLKDDEDLVVGITGRGNKIFGDIKDAINGYLGGTQGTEVDFQLLKDSVDRHCDMIEDEINSQMPLPLYFGLAGTMIGAIIGLFALVFGGSILELMAGTSGTVEIGAASNINDLLWGVAIAMVASAIGIVLTSWNTIYFKNKKLLEETGKNKFLAWMQSKVLPAVPSNVSQQMKALVRQLSTFNRNFKSNTDAINLSLSQAKDVYQSQANVIERYSAIDLEGMANGISIIIGRLRNGTESLDRFTQYINLVHEYYDEMQVFAERLNQETERIGILQDIQRFFQSHKAVIAEETAEAHKNIQQSIEAVRDSTQQQVIETYAALTEQSQRLRSAVDENNEQFRTLCQDMRNKFQEQMDAMPTVADNLKKLEGLPNKLENAISCITKSQEDLAKNFLQAASKIVNTKEKESIHDAPICQPVSITPSFQIPAFIKWTIVVGITVIALATIGNTAYNIFGKSTDTVLPVEQIEENGTSSPIVPTENNDTINA